MLSAFGVDHGDISKAFGGSLLGQATKASHSPGAGGMLASKLSGGLRQGQRGNFAPARAAAKKQGHQAAKQFGQMGSPKSYGGYEGAHPGIESANTGWNSRAASKAALGGGSAGKAPAGMRGPIKSRVTNSRMAQQNRNFT